MSDESNSNYNEDTDKDDNNNPITAKAKTKTKNLKQPIILKDTWALRLKDCSLMVVKKMLRFLPVYLATIYCSIHLNDLNVWNYAVTRDFLFLKRRDSNDSPVNYSVGWSNGVDVNSSIMLFIAMYILRDLNQLSWRGGTMYLLTF